jgi:hypothetical protein
MLLNELVDFARCLAIVKIAALHRQSLQESPNQPKQDLKLRYLDEIDGLAVGLEGVKGFLLIDLRIVVEGAEHNLIVFRELPDLVVSPEFVAFFKRIGYAG